MKWPKFSFSVRTRLIALSLGLMTLLGTANLVLAYMINQNEVHQLYQREQYRRSEIIRGAEQAILRERHIGGQLSAAQLSGHSYGEDQLNEQLAVARQDQKNSVQKMDVFNPEAAQTIRQALERVPRLQKQIIDAITAGRNSEFPSLVATMQAHLDTVQRALEEASSIEQQRAEDMATRELHRISQAKRIAGSIVLITLLAGAVLTFILVRSILTPLKATTVAIRQLNLGHAHIDLPPIGKDEFGDMALALRQFRDQAEILRRRAYEDSLTGLWNRARLEEELPKALTAAHNQGTSVAILCLNLDNFRAINDRFGHRTGDRYLCEAVSRLHRFMPPEAVLFRYAGDNFVVQLDELPNGKALESRLKEIASTALRGLSEPYVVGDQLANMSVSIGIAAFPSDGNTAEQLISGADAAMHLAKKNGRNNLRFASSRATGTLRKQLSITGDIRRGLERGEFLTYYQPIVDADKRLVTGAEALLRWQHPERGLLLPGEFIYAAEQSGLIGNLGELCLISARSQSLEWQAAGRQFRVSVNLSAHQVHEGKVLNVLKGFDDFDNPDNAKLIDFELTESALIDVAERGQSTLDEIKSMGYRLGLDDFGIAYSSLSYLQTLPIDKIKIDRQFTTALINSRAATAIVSAIITLARALDLEVIAEGVETAAQQTELIRMGCPLQQGFYYSKAVAPKDFMAWAERYEGMGIKEESNLS